MCPFCHTENRPTDYFCYNCGKSLRPAPLKTSFQDQIILYIKCIFLPPLGIIWGVNYLRQPESTSKSKLIGFACIVITLVAILYAIKFTQDFVDTLTSQINTQMGSFSP